jgi:hypothetical protein
LLTENGLKTILRLTQMLGGGVAFGLVFLLLFFLPVLQVARFGDN